MSCSQAPSSFGKSSPHASARGSMSVSDAATAERVLRPALVPASKNQRCLDSTCRSRPFSVLVQYDVLGLGNRLLSQEVAPARCRWKEMVSGLLRDRDLLQGLHIRNGSLRPACFSLRHGRAQPHNYLSGCSYRYSQVRNMQVWPSVILYFSLSPVAPMHSWSAAGCLLCNE